MSDAGFRIQIDRLDNVLRGHGLDHTPEEDFPNDGWSGASLTRLRRGGGDRFILKRDSLHRDWIARATDDGPVLREAWFAARAPILDQFFSDRIRASYVGVGRVGDEFGMLMPDLSDSLFDWERPISIDALDRVLTGVAALHTGLREFGHGFSEVLGDPDYPGGGPWCPLLERITLISRVALERPGPARDAVAERLLPGWDAFDRRAPAAARALVAGLGDNPRPLVDALDKQPRALIHGDLKLANVGIGADGVIDTVDWQMVSFAPVAVELGWFLVANVECLPVPPIDVLRKYRSCLAAMSEADEDQRIFGDWELDQDGVDAAILVGLLLRGWRKGADTEAGVIHASGVSAADDLAWWCERAVEAADRIL
jgi:hypothetical protein